MLLLLTGGGIYIAKALRHKPEVFRQILIETAQEDADILFGKSEKYFLPLLSIYNSDDNLLDTEGNPVTYKDLWSTSTELSLYQSKVNDLVKDIDEYRIGDLVVHEKDPSFGNMITADVKIIFKWYDFSSVIDEFNRHAYNQFLPYLMVGSDRTFPVIDNLLLSILEKVEAAGMTREYEAVHRYYLSEGGSNPVTGKGAHWSTMAESGDRIREMILEELNYADQFKDDVSEEELNERKEIIINMEIAFEMFGKDKAKELLESLGYEGLVTKMISYTPAENTGQ